MNRSPAPLRLLIVEDSKEVVVLLRRHLESCGYDVSCRHVEDAPGLAAALDEESWDIVISDHFMPNFSSLGTIQVVRERRPDTPVIVISGRIDDSAAAGLMNAGARDFIPKTNLARLHPVIIREVEDFARRRRISEIQVDKDNALRELTETLHSLEQTQEQIIRTERYQALCQIASGVAHDFNNSLTKMIGIIEVILASSPQIVTEIQQLKEFVLDATKIVQRLRAFYKPVAICADAGLLDINAVVESAVELARPKWKTQCQADGRHITVSTDLAAVPPVRGRFDELREAILILLLNSVDALPHGGTISLVTRGEAGTVSLSITDDGVGMAPETLQRCFEPYFTTKGKPHLGLGLGLVNRLMRSLGGGIDLQSTEGEGTTATLRLPECQGLTAEAAAAEECFLPPEPLRILVADDDLAVRILLSQLLTLDGHTVELAENGRDALEKFDPASHQLVISDRAMPVLNGEQLARGIKARAPRVPVIMTSGFVDLLSGDTEKPRDVDFLLAKPVTRDSLRNSLSTALRLRAELDRPNGDHLVPCQAR